MKISWLMMLRETITVYFKNLRHSVEKISELLLNLKADGIYNNHCGLKR